MKRTLDDGDWYRPREAARLEEEAASLDRGFQREAALARAIQQGAELLIAVAGSTLLALYFVAEPLAWDWAVWFVLTAVGLGVAAHSADRYVENRRGEVTEDIHALRQAALELREQHRQLRAARLSPGGPMGRGSLARPDCDPGLGP